MKQKHINKAFVIAALMGANLTIDAQTKMVVQTSGGDTEFSISELSKITFADNKLNVNMMNNYNSHFALSTVEKIVFQNTSNSIDNNSVDEMAKHAVYFKNGSLCVNNWNHADITNVMIYSMSGQMVESIKQWNGQPINLDRLTNGIYIIRLNDETYKFIKQ